MAPYAFPQLMEKLDSGSSNIKVSLLATSRFIRSNNPKSDVIQTLHACVQSYRLEVLCRYSPTLWDSLKYEVLNPQEDDLAEEAVAVLQTLISRLCAVEHPSSSCPPPVLDSIITECMERIKEPQHKQAKAASRLLEAIARTTTLALFATVDRVIPSILLMYADAGTIEEKRAVIEPLKLLLDSDLSICGSPKQIPDSNTANPLRPFKDRLFSLLTQALQATTNKEPSFRMLVLDSLLALCQMRDLMEDAEIALVVQYLENIAVDEGVEFQRDLQRGAIQGLLRISKVQPELIATITIPRLLCKLPESELHPMAEYTRALSVLASLSAEPELFDLLTRRLFGCLDVAVSKEIFTQYIEALLSSLYFAFSQPHWQDSPQFASQRARILKLLQHAAELCTLGARHPLLNESTFDALGKIIYITVRASDIEFQTEIAEQVYKLYTGGPVFIFLNGTGKISFFRRLTVILSTHLVAALPYHVSFCPASI